MGPFDLSGQVSGSSLGHRSTGDSLSAARHVAPSTPATPPAMRDTIQVSLRVFGLKLTAQIELSAVNLRYWLVNTTVGTPYRAIKVQVGRPGFIPARLWPTQTRSVYMVGLAQDLVFHLRLRKQIPELKEIQVAFGACPHVSIDNAGHLFEA